MRGGGRCLVVEENVLRGEVAVADGWAEAVQVVEAARDVERDAELELGLRQQRRRRSQHRVQRAVLHVLLRAGVSKIVAGFVFAWKETAHHDDAVLLANDHAEKLHNIREAQLPVRTISVCFFFFFWAGTNTEGGTEGKDTRGSGPPARRARGRSFCGSSHDR